MALPGMHIFIWGHEWGHTVNFLLWPIGGESVAVTSLFKGVTSQLLIRKGAAFRVGLVQPEQVLGRHALR